MANCTICGKILSFFDKSKSCPECVEAHKAMMETENRDIAMTICEHFQKALPGIQDKEVKAFLTDEINKTLARFKPEEPLMHTTTSGFDGYAIREYKEIVMVKEVYETGKTQALDRLKEARPSFNKLDRQAKKLGANAIVGIEIDYSMVVCDQSGMWSKIMETVSGTAVVVEKIHERVKFGEQYD